MLDLKYLNLVKVNLVKRSQTLTKWLKNNVNVMNNLGEKKIGETKPNLDVPTFNIELKEVEKIKVKSDHEIELDKYQEQKRLEREAYIKKEREKENTIKFEVVSPIRKDPNRGMKFVKCNNEPINRGRLGHSKTFLKDIKKDRGYY